jgi:predicted XRE-type DNA-binding protein
MSPSVERWLPVAGHEGLYEVSDQGRVKSLPRQTRSGLRGGKVLKPRFKSNGYLQVGLHREGVMRTETVHTLVLTAFVGSRPEALQCCHSDGDPANNRLENLRWGTAKENIADKLKHGTDSRGEKHRGARLRECQVIEIRKDPRTHQEIANEMGISRSEVSNIKNRRSWSWLERAGAWKDSRSPRKLKPADVRAIREDPRRHQEIAADYGISRPHVSDIKAGRRWSRLGRDEEASPSAKCWQP